MANLQSLTAQPSTAATLLALTVGVGLASRLLMTSKAEAESAASGKMKTFSKGPAFVWLKLHSTEDVTHNMRRLRFELPNPEAVSGLGLTSALLTLSWPKGRMLPVPRPYTPVSPLDEPGFLDLLVKHYPNGKASTHLHSLKPGDALFIAAAIPGYAWRPNLHPRVTLIAGGAGITPIFQLAQGILTNPSDRTRITLVYAAQTAKDLALKEKLDAWEREFPGRFKAVYTVSQQGESKEGGVRKGYVTGELLKEVAPKDGEGEAKVFVCGPPPMEKALVGARGGSGILAELGYRKDQVYKF
ncbi:NADH-cytochrome b5 reductase [Pleurostoma richardsiae]|uniref:NADH-cytochrome b5 reductase n=1 Tax=Pleurostoma richardsiae TaxID=41990 RepID=A0AA38S0Z5_9PEZI|nr:NADH-cytochrome b5 reductase [Pleurostoma richardsiae]